MRLNFALRVVCVYAIGNPDMKKTFLCSRITVMIVFSAVTAVAINRVVSADETSPPETQQTPAHNPASTETPKPTLKQARRQAEILHTSIHATLQVVHDRYYREDEGLPIPASILGDVFRELEDTENIKLRWLAVEGLAMNTDHQPQDDFETEAVKILKSGKSSHDQLENGLYRRAAPIILSSHCLKCHMPDRKSTRDRTAGLIIAIPVEE